MKIIITIAEKLIAILKRIGSMLNETPTHEEMEKLTTSAKFKTNIWEKTQAKDLPSNVIKLGKIQGRKGGEHADEKIFNHPRR